MREARCDAILWLPFNARTRNLSDGVTPDRVKALREAFDATMKDPEFLAEAARPKLVNNPVSGQMIAGLLDRVSATPQQLLDRVTAVSTKN